MIKGISFPRSSSYWRSFSSYHDFGWSLIILPWVRYCGFYSSVSTIAGCSICQSSSCCHYSTYDSCGTKASTNNSVLSYFRNFCYKIYIWVHIFWNVDLWNFEKLEMLLIGTYRFFSAPSSLAKIYTYRFGNRSKETHKNTEAASSDFSWSCRPWTPVGVIWEFLRFN